MSDYEKSGGLPMYAPPSENPSPMFISPAPINPVAGLGPSPANSSFADENADSEKAGSRGVASRLLLRWGIKLLVLGGGMAVAVHLVSGDPARDIVDIRKQAGFSTKAPRLDDLKVKIPIAHPVGNSNNAKGPSQ